MIKRNFGFTLIEHEHSKSVSRNESFTLIELLVVIAIVGLLSSIVIVNLDLGGKKQRARIAKSLSFSQSLQNVLGSEAVGIWTFDDCAANDLTSYGNNGAINGAVCSSDTPQAILGQGSGKNALSFDGTDDYVVNTSAVGLPSTAMTLEAWINISSLTSWRVIVSHDKDSAGGWNVNIDGSGNANFTIYNGVSYFTGYKAGISVNNWYHIVGVYDGTNIKMYINGQIGTDAVISSVFLDSVGDLYIGSDNYTSNHFNGLLDEIRVYGKAMTSGEIQKHYAEGLERHQNLAIK